MTIRVGTDVICSHTIVPGHGRVIREKEHFMGLLAEAMRCNDHQRKVSRPLFAIIAPPVEQRSLAVYDAFTDEVGL